MHISCRCFHINITKPECKTQPNEMRGRYLSTFCKCPGVTVLLVFILLLISGVSGHCWVQAYQGEEFTQSHTEETQQWLYTSLWSVELHHHHQHHHCALSPALRAPEEETTSETTVILFFSSFLILVCTEPCMTHSNS